MSATSDPRGRGITVTIKYGTSYDAPWIVFHGLAEDIHADITTCFGIDPADSAGLSLADIVLNASTHARGLGTVAAGLGGTVIAAEPSSRSNAERDARPAPSPAAAEPEPHPLIGIITQVPDVRSLERLWVENQEAFSDPAVMAAWKDRGRALSRA